MTSSEKRIHVWLLIFSVALVMLRFVSPGIVPFIVDEPVFQEWAEQILRTGHWPLVCMGGSSIPVSYGGGAIWLYTIPHFFSTSPLAFTLFHTIVYCFCFLFLYLALRRLLNPLSAAWALLLATSSPFLFFFSRHTWDTTFFVPFTAFMIFCYSRLLPTNENDKWLPNVRNLLPLLGISLTAALCINIQLAIGPFILTIYLALLFWLLRYENKNQAAWLAVISCGLLMIILCVPYALAAREFMTKNASIMAQTHYERWGNGRHLWFNILYALFGISTWHANTFFEPVNEDFITYAGAAWKFIFHLDLMGWIVKLSALFTLLSAPVFLLRKQWKEISILHALLATGFFVVLFTFQYLNVPVQPHYFQSMWWVPFTAVAIFFFRLAEWAKKYYAACLSLAALTNIAFLAFTLGYITQNGGVRGIYHSTGILETRKAVEGLCLLADQEREKNIIVDITGIAIGTPPIQYFLSHLPECKNIIASVPSSRDPSANYRMEYDDNRSNARFHAVKVK